MVGTVTSLKVCPLCRVSFFSDTAPSCQWRNAGPMLLDLSILKEKPDIWMLVWDLTFKQCFKLKRKRKKKKNHKAQTHLRSTVCDLCSLGLFSTGPGTHSHLCDVWWVNVSGGQIPFFTEFSVPVVWLLLDFLQQWCGRCFRKLCYYSVNFCGCC